jgi:hypothetical protein
MIKLENYEVVGWEHAIRGMRNPKNSWERSDSGWDAHIPPIELRAQVDWDDYAEQYIRVQDDGEYSYDVGPNDQKLMMNLAKGGPVHAKYRRFIDVYVDITAPLYWWKEFDTYKVGTAANSCSTMHKIADKEFEIYDFSFEHLMGDGGEIEAPLLADPNDQYNAFSPENMFVLTVRMLNACRAKYLEAKVKPMKEESKRADLVKKYWWQMIQLLPSSYNQKRTVKLNYEVLTGIYTWRKDHKLDEWREFCKWIESLPYSEIITGEPKTEIAYLCDGEQCDPCNNIDCHHTLDIKHAVNFEKVDDHKYMEMEHNPLAHPETYVSDAIAMINDMTNAQRDKVMEHLNTKVTASKYAGYPWGLDDKGVPHGICTDEEDK